MDATDQRKKAYKNVGTLAEMQDILHAGLEPIVSKALRAAWGPSWVDELNDRRTGRKVPPSRKRVQVLDPVEMSAEGLPLWDMNQLLHTIRENNADLRGAFRGPWQQIFAWCHELTDGRNVNAHARPATRVEAAKDRRTVYFAERAAGLLRAFGNEEAASRIDAIADTFFDQGMTVGEAPRSDEIEREAPAAEAPPVLSSEPPPPVLVRRSRRRKPLPDPASGVALFPLVGEGAASADDLDGWGSVVATVYEQEGSGSRALAPGFDHTSDHFYQIIADARADEANAAAVNLKTCHRFDPIEFAGSSYGLATAIADRTARYGMSPQYVARRLAATGTILTKRCGEVGAIVGLLEKIAIVERSLPPGGLFILPKENLDKVDDAVRMALDGLSAKGIEWRAIRHVDELNDILAVAAPASPVAAVTVEVSSVPADEHPEETASASHTPPSPVSFPRRDGNPFRLVREAAIVFGVGIALLVVLYGVARYRDSFAKDPAVVQSSDERLQRLSQADVVLGAPTLTARACEALVGAAQAVTDYDRTVMDQYARQALDHAQACSQRLKDSAERLATLERAATASDASGATGLVRLARAFASLTSFDTGSEPSDQVRSAMASGEAAVTAVRESDGRIADFVAKASIWSARQSDGNALEAAVRSVDLITPLDEARATSDQHSMMSAVRRQRSLLVDSNRRLAQAVIAVSALEAKDTADNRASCDRALSALTSFDRSHVAGGQSEILERGSTLLGKLRLSDVKSAVTAFRASGGKASDADALAAAYRSLTDADRVRYDSELGSVRGDVDAATSAIIQSNARLGSLVRAAATATAWAKSHKTGVIERYSALLSLADGLEQFDRDRLGDEARSALATVERVRTLLADSDQRIAEAMTWSEFALKYRGTGVPWKLMSKVGASRGSLTELDKERLSGPQKATLEDACGVPVEPQAGVMPALPGSECLQDIVPVMKPLPALAP